MLAVRARQAGGPEVLEAVDLPTPTPGPEQILVRHEAVGLNYIDTYQRSGLYPIQFPAVLGTEGAGRVEAVGERVDRFKVGDAVAYAGVSGAYGELNAVPASRAVALPAAVSTRIAAAALLKGMTVEYLVRRTFKVQKGQNVFVHAAAGGVGLILCQWANHLGANVIGTVGSKEKAELAKANGCHHTILYRDEDFVARTKDITKGAMCSVVYDGIGKTTFPASLDCLAPLGMFVSFGSASGQVEAFNINILQTKGSLFATRPTLNTYAAKRADLLDIASHLFEVVESGAVKIPVNQKYALKDAAKAHRDLESRGTTGSSILIP